MEAWKHCIAVSGLGDCYMQDDWLMGPDPDLGIPIVDCSLQEPIKQDRLPLQQGIANCRYRR